MIIAVLLLMMNVGSATTYAANEGREIHRVGQTRRQPATRQRGQRPKRQSDVRHTNVANPKGKSETSPPRQSAGQERAAGDIRVLAEGSQARVADKSIVVARDAESYNALRRDLGSRLPELSADFFRTNRVVATFLGTRRTGGDSVDIARTPTAK